MSPLQLAFSQTLSRLNGIILGKDHLLRLAQACLLARGHLLIEGLPGVGKTTLAHALAQCCGLQFRRVQFTSDMLPADLIGVSVYERSTEKFRFHPGPVFSQLLLADEINRASPKTQSALLEAMEEHQISVDGMTHALPEPFFVIATQNPLQQIGTYPLPESQLDRFLLRVELGYPDPQAERELLQGIDRRSALLQLEPVVTPQQLALAQQEIRHIHASEALIDYIQALVAATRSLPEVVAGLSPRAALGLLAVARAYAWQQGRNLVLPEDVQEVFPCVANHRLLIRSTGMAQQGLSEMILQQIPVN
ncbi:AAA family ATPase [Chitinilyticum piscinae]|uniref:MoxR family ATPase n=1 Tax=Chitinilyticum piscinae TaxID=2866724 RepID=A0A8J7FRB4_9NEIS|nr:MoxR family ATPase [Chitinilyticum piscinae]MBE9609411.1 MoxR family ATPase [Chitinilyticum piscinae]